MIKRPFFSLGRPKLGYLVDHEQDAVREIPLPKKVTLFLKLSDVGKGDLKVGDEVKTGQKLKPAEDSEDYLISTVTGTIADISEYTGYLGQSYTSISIDVAGEDQWDDGFQEAAKAPNPESARNFLRCLPGKSDFASLLNPQAPVNTVVINGIDQDLLVTTNQSIVKTEVETLTEGIDYLKKVVKVQGVTITVSPDLASLAEKTGAEVKVVKPVYPNTLPNMIVKDVLGKVVPAGMSCEQMGIGFINAEAVASLANAFSNGKIPVDKTLTVINKGNTPVIVRARIGTHVKDILDALDIETFHGDRLVVGGPMSGNAIYSEDMPVLSDTDAIMVQDKTQIALISDGQCVNCGECIRACPVKIPVNMLVRVLGNSLYEEAANEYDLLSCIECGLCSYVCIAQIPVFHHIMLGKHEFARIKSAEESNA